MKSLMKEFRVDRSMMGRHAPESYRTTKRGQTDIPEEPPRGIGRLLVGRKTRPRRGIESSAAEQKQTKIECVPWMPKTKQSANCNGPEEIYKSHTLANVFYNSSEGFSTPVTSPLMPPKPARTERKHYSWRNSSKREICMCICILDPLELRNNSRKESMDENKRSMNYREAEYLFPDGKGMVTSWISDVTIGEQDGKLGRNKLVVRQYEKTRVCLRSSAEKGCRKVIKSYNKVITVMTFYCILVTQLLKGIASPRRCERKSTVGNSERFSSSTSVRDYEDYAFYSVLERLGNILRYKLLLLLFLIIHGLWGKYEVMRNQNKEIWKFMKTLTFRLVVAILGYVTYCLATFLETFGLRSGSIMKTFMEGKRFEICLSPFSDLRASCHTQLRSLLINLEFGKRLKVNYVYIYLYIYRLCHCMLSCKWASFPLAFAVKLYTLVYFSSKASLLMRKSHKKYQSIDLIGLALGEKAYVDNRSFLDHNRSYWRELRPLVTPWTWPIKEGTEPWKGQIGFSCLMSKVSLLPLSLSSPSLTLVLVVVLLLFHYGYVLVKGKNSNKY